MDDDCEGYADLGFGTQTDNQIHALYGASMFGAWGYGTGAAPFMDSQGDVLSSGGRRNLWIFLAAIGCVTSIAAMVLNHGLSHHASRSVKSTAERVALLLRGGAIPQLAILLDDPAHGGSLKDASSGHRSLYCRAQATVYRFLDARRERLCDPDDLSASAATNDAATYDVVVARALVLPAVDRVAMLDELRAAEQHNTTDPQAAYLVATALATQPGELRAAENALNRALTREPTNLIHLAAQARLLLRRGQARRAAGVLDQMREVNPEAPWVAVAALEQKPDSATALQEQADGFPRVLRGEMALASALSAWKKDQADVARQAVRDAGKAVGLQAPFIIDQVDRLCSANAVPLAQTLLETDGWPLHLPAAKAASERVVLASKTTDKSSTAAKTAPHKAKSATAKKTTAPAPTRQAKRRSTRKRSTTAQKRHRLGTQRKKKRAGRKRLAASR